MDPWVQQSVHRGRPTNHDRRICYVLYSMCYYPRRKGEIQKGKDDRHRPSRRSYFLSSTCTLPLDRNRLLFFRRLVTSSYARAQTGPITNSHTTSDPSEVL